MTEAHRLRTQAEVLRFVESARAYCSLLEVEPDDHQVWMHAILAALADVYAAAHHLSVSGHELASDFPAGSFDPSAEAIKEIRHRVERVLGDDNLYWCSLNVRVGLSAPEREDSLGVGDVSDDLTDIYRDLNPGLRAWDENRDEYLPDIIFDWKEPLFASHWGRHAVDALRAIHSLVYE